MITREQIIEIRAQLTLGDAEVAKREAKGDEQKQAILAIQRRAVKLGFAPEGIAHEDFLDLVRIEDIKALAAPEVTAPLVPTPGLSLDSAATGE